MINVSPRFWQPLWLLFTPLAWGVGVLVMVVGCGTSPGDEGDSRQWAGEADWWTRPPSRTDDKPAAAMRSSGWAGDRDWWTEGHVVAPDTVKREPRFEWSADSELWHPPQVTRVAETKVRIAIEGNESISRGTLGVAASDAVRELEATGGSPASADDLAFTLAEVYRRRGFPFATVTASLRMTVERTPEWLFKVVEGSRVRLGEIVFRGVTAFAVADLQQQFEGTRDWPLGESYYVAETVEVARNRLIERYRDAGFLRVRISPPQVEFVNSDRERPEAPPDQARLTLDVSEGPQYRVERIEVEGVEGDLRGAISRVTDGYLGRPFAFTDGPKLTAQVREVLQNRGHILAHVDLLHAIDHAHASVTLRLVATPGAVYTVGRVEVESTSIRAEFLRGILPLRGEAEQPYSISAVRDSYRQIMRTNLVRAIKTETKLNHALRTVDFTFVISEVSSLEFSPHLGWGSYEGLRGQVTIAENNAFNSARIASLVLGASLRGEWIELGWRDPWTLGGVGDFPWGLSLFYRRREEPNFTRQDVGGILSVEHAFNSQWLLGLSYELRDTRAFNLIDPGVGADRENVLLGTLGLRLRFSDTQPLLIPRRGMNHSLRVQYANQPIGAALEFVRLKLESALYMPLDVDERVVLALGYRLEVVLAAGDTRRVPIQERVFNGGPTSVRGFPEQGLRPWDEPNSTAGGEFAQTVTLELRFPVVWTIGLDGAVFLDAGNLVTDAREAFDHFRVALGFGLRYLTPIGPIRIDVGWNSYPRNREDRWVVHFWIGYPF